MDDLAPDAGEVPAALMVADEAPQMEGYAIDSGQFHLSIPVIDNPHENPPGRMPSSTAGKMPAATLNPYLAGSAFLRLVCRQDAVSTLGFMDRAATASQREAVMVAASFNPRMTNTQTVWRCVATHEGLNTGVQPLLRDED